MSNNTIANYSLAGSIDPVNDLLLLEQFSTTSYKSINRNVLLGLSSQPLGLTDTQSPTNKTFNNTNTFTIKDGSLTLENSADVTKIGVFSLSGNTTGTTRTYTLPDRSSTIATLGGNQTFTGANSFTGSSWSGGTIDNSTVTVDTISGHTTANSGSVYGVAITSGVITTTNSVGSGTIVQNGVQANELATNAISLGYAASTSTFSTASATPVQVTGLSSTVTIPAGGRKVKITAFLGDVTNSANDYVTITLWDGTVGSGTQIARSRNWISTTARSVTGVCMAVQTPAAGSKTYNVGMTAEGGGTVSSNPDSTDPMFILVEAI